MYTSVSVHISTNNGYIFCLYFSAGRKNTMFSSLHFSKSLFRDNIANLDCVNLHS